MTDGTGWGSPAGGDDSPRPPLPPSGWGTAPGWVPPPPEPKPGVIPLRPLSVGEILDGAVTTIRSYPRATLGLAAVVVTISQLVQFTGLALFRNRLSTSVSNLPETPTFSDVADLLSGTATVLVVSTVVAALAQLVLTGLVTVVVSKGALGQPCGIGEAWSGAQGQLWRLLGVTLLAALAATAALLVPILPGVALIASGATALGGLLLAIGVVTGIGLSVHLYVSFALASPAVVLERQGVVTSLRRSRTLVKGTWWRILGILLLSAIIVQVVSGVISVPFSLVTGGASIFGGNTGAVSLLSLALGSVGTIISGTITWPFAAAVSALLYIDVRMRREGLDIELARAAGLPVPRTPPQPW